MSLNFSATARNKIQGDDLKRLLIDCAKNEKVNFVKIADAFYKQNYRNKSHYIEFCKEVIKAIDKVLSAGDWNDSLFLRNTVKPLRELREEAALILAQATRAVDQHPDQVTQQVAEDSVQVFISMFQSDGHNLQKWAMQLRSITKYLIGRPVYANEADVQKVIRMKLQQASEAYIVVAIKKAAIRQDPFEPERFDRYGNKLLMLTPGAVEVSNILRFVHYGKVYRFIDGHLVK